MLGHRPRGACGLLAAITMSLTACQSGTSFGADAGQAPAPVSSSTPSGITEEFKEPNTLEGIYTPTQAQRGRGVYDAICSNCHKTEDWQDESFLARWEGESVYRFWFYIYESMPEGEPPYSLPRDQVSDVVTFILQLNGVPAGEAELGSDDDSIAQHWLYWGHAPSVASRVLNKD